MFILSLLIDWTNTFIEYHTPVYDQKHTIKKHQYNGKAITLLLLKNVVITKNGNVTRFSEILYIISIISLDQWQLAKNNRQPEKLFKKVTFICRVPVYGIAPLSFRISAGTLFTKKQSLSLTEQTINWNAIKRITISTQTNLRKHWNYNPKQFSQLVLPVEYSWGHSSRPWPWCGHAIDYGVWMKMLEFRLNFHWSLFLRVQLTIFQHWFG